jgi:hypothetical protein
MGIDIFHGYGFGTAKPSGFVPVAISSYNFRGQANISTEIRPIHHVHPLKSRRQNLYKF